MLRHLRAALAGCVIATASIAQQDTTAFDPITFELAYSAAETSQERRDILQAALARINAAPDPEIGLYFDLNLLLIDELEISGELAQAALIATQLAQFAVRQGAEFGIDAIAQISRAVRLAEAAGDYPLALRLRESEFAYRQDGGQSGEELARVWEKTADLAGRMGQTDEVTRLQAAAEALRAAPASSPTRKAGDDGGFREVDVYYATDRARSGLSEPSEMYGSGRGELEYGTLRVTIPNVHVPGAIEAPSIWRLEFSENPARHVILQSVTPLESRAFFSKMQAEMEGRESKEAFVFIHGFNVRFDAAAKRAAQLAHDMNYRGVPVLYSWPSAGKTVSYVADTAVVRLSGRRLATFLEELHAQSGAETIHIVAHSMGNRALTDALELLASRRSARELDEPLFGQIFFAAPDVDAGLFAEMTKAIRPLAERMTLYTSRQDWALVTSRKLHGNAPRAGQAGDSLLQEPHFDTVDMSDLGEDMLAHSYFANDSSALVDIMALLWRNADPRRRCGLEPIEAGAGTAWVYEKGQCNVAMIMGLIAFAWQNKDADIAEIRELIARYMTDPAKAAEIEDRFVSILGED
ncbi:hypothetical protein FIU94_19505 (plasmid) [Sulfitobacter sp. THAF37]|nr:hypothetical protein FIU94_19505 [Sulfitobacter sp. THAF37]